MKNSLAAIAVAAAAYLFSISGAAAQGWHIDTQSDDFSGTVNISVDYIIGDKWMANGCDINADGEVFWFSTIEFGDFNFIGSDGEPRKMMVKYNNDRPQQLSGWRIWENDGSKITRGTFNRSIFLQQMIDMVEAKKFAYRVTAYDTDEFTFRSHTGIGQDLFDELMQRCDTAAGNG